MFQASQQILINIFLVFIALYHIELTKKSGHLGCFYLMIVVPLQVGPDSGSFLQNELRGECVPSVQLQCVDSSSEPDCTTPRHTHTPLLPF